MGKKFEQNSGAEDSLKGPSLRIIGEISDEAREVLFRKIKGVLHRDHYGSLPPEVFAELKEKELVKTPEELKLIAMADKGTSKIMESVGEEPYSIPEKNVHLLPGDSYNKTVLNDKPEQSSARAISESQAIFVNADKAREKELYFALLIFHEMMHLKGKIIMEANEDENRLYAGAYKTGLTVFSPRVADSRNREHTHMSGLEEALVSDEEKKYVEKILKLPRFLKEREAMEAGDFKNLRKNIARRDNISENNVFWVSDDKKSYLCFSYQKQREALGFVEAEILKENRDKYENSNDVREEFLKAFFGGSLYNISRLVESTFGKGSFRVLGLMTREDGPAIGVMEALRSMRRAKVATVSEK